MKDGKRLIDANELKRQIIAFATGCATTVLPIETIIDRIDAADTVSVLQNCGAEKYKQNKKDSTF